MKRLALWLLAFLVASPLIAQQYECPTNTTPHPYFYTIDSAGVRHASICVDANGDLLFPRNLSKVAGTYVNFSPASGTGGYGFRDNAGTMEYKNSGGAWAAFGGGGGAITPGALGQTVRYANTGTQLTGSNAFLVADAFAGANGGAKLAACVTAAIAAGSPGCDARGLTGAQAISTDIFAGVAGNITVLLPTGPLTSGVGLTVPSNVHLIGPHSKTILRFAGLGAGVDCVTVAGFSSQPNLENIVLDANSTGRDALRIKSGLHLKHDGLEIKNAVRDGIHVEPAANGDWLGDYIIENILIQDVGRDGIRYELVPTLTSTFINQGNWTNVEIRRAGEHQVHFKLTSNVAGTKISALTVSNMELDNGGAAGNNPGWYMEQPSGTGTVEAISLIGSAIEDTGGIVTTATAIYVAQTGFVSGFYLYNTLYSNFANIVNGSAANISNFVNMAPSGTSHYGSVTLQGPVNSPPLLLFDTTSGTGQYLRNESGFTYLRRQSDNAEMLHFGNGPVVPIGSGYTWAGAGGTSWTCTNPSSIIKCTSSSAGQSWGIGTNVTATNTNNYNGPSYGLESRYWTGAADAPDEWSLTNVLGAGANPTSTLTFGHTGSSGTTKVTFPSIINTVTGYQVSGAATLGHCLVGNGTIFGDAACPAGGPGTGTQYAAAFWDTTLTLGSIGTVPAANGFYQLGYNVTGGAAVAPDAYPVGVTNRSVTGATATDTILYSDNVNRVEYTGSVAVAVTLPAPATLGNTHFATRLANHTTGSSTAVTVTPTTWTINGAATLVIAQGQTCTLTVGAGTDWSADCSVLASSGSIGLLRQVTTLSAAQLLEFNAVNVLSAAANHVGATTVYTGVFPNCAVADALKIGYYTVDGFTTPANNGIFLATACTGTTLTLANGAGAAESAAATATNLGFKVVDAPGVNKIVFPHNLFAEYLPNTTPFTLGNIDNQIDYSYDGITNPLGASLKVLGLVDQAAKTFLSETYTWNGQGYPLNGANETVKLVLWGTTPGLTLGDGSLVVTVEYTIVDLY